MRKLLHSVTIAVQRGGALSYLHRYEQPLRKVRTASAASDAKPEARQRDKERMDEESEKESAPAA